MSLELSVGKFEFGASLNKKPYSTISLQSGSHKVEQRIYFGVTNLLTPYKPNKKAYLLSLHLLWLHLYIGGV